MRSGNKSRTGFWAERRMCDVSRSHMNKPDTTELSCLISTNLCMTFIIIFLLLLFMFMKSNPKLFLPAFYFQQINFIDSQIVFIVSLSFREIVAISVLCQCLWKLCNFTANDQYTRELKWTLSASSVTLLEIARARRYRHSISFVRIVIVHHKAWIIKALRIVHWCDEAKKSRGTNCLLRSSLCSYSVFYLFTCV